MILIEQNVQNVNVIETTQDQISICALHAFGIYQVSSTSSPGRGYKRGWIFENASL